MAFQEKSRMIPSKFRLGFVKRMVLATVVGILCVVIVLMYLQSVSYTHNVQMIADYQKSTILITPWKTKQNYSESDTWMTLGNPKRRHKVYSAFFDNRPEIVGWHPLSESGSLYGSVRVFAIMKTRLNSEISCHYFNSTGDEVSKVGAQASAIRENFGLPYSAYTIMCPLSNEGSKPIIELPKFVALSDDMDPMTLENPILVSIRYNKASLRGQEPSRSLAICTGPIHNNYGQARRIVEYVHIAQLMGVEKVYFYLMEATSAVADVLDHFQNTDFVQVLTWNLDGYVFEKDLRYAGIFAALNDCVYRATFVDDFKYVAIVDLDEILVSFKHKNLTNFIKSIDTGMGSAFIFRGVFFHENDIDSNFKPPNGVKNNFLYTQSRRIRTIKPLPSHVRSKYVVNARSAIEIGNHFVWNSIYGKKEVVIDPEDGLLFHYRDECMGSTCNAPKEIDTKMARYADDIWKLVDETCQTVFQDGICPVDK